MSDNDISIAKGAGLMTAAYQRELDFALHALAKLRLRAQVYAPNASLAGIDAGLRALLGIDDDSAGSLIFSRRWNQDHTIYQIMDPFLCHYVYFRLPAAESALVIGPYLTIDPSRELLLEQAEQLNLPLHLLPRMTEYYASLPVFNDPGPMMAIVYTFAEHIWGGRAFDVVDVNHENRSTASSSADAPIEQPGILQQMKLMEERYAYEDMLMDAVAKGQATQVEAMMSGISHLMFQQRVADPLRNMKNYSIICNTLLRKAAQRGGVHPLHLDRISSQYARAIETCPSLDAFNGLISEMLRAYCRLVRTRSSSHYSAVVQKTLTYIDANLSGDLSLTTLAGLMGVSPGYLSALFHRETGENLSACIANQRMNAALQLLTSTRLQVQTIAQLCGFSDPNYFGKQFRKHYGMTPLAYRREQALQHRSEGQ